MFTYFGEINVSVIRDRLAPGSILAHYGDDAGYGPATPTRFYDGIQWQRASEIPDGSDLDAYRSCGTFAGRKLNHTPGPLGSNFIRVQVICSRDNNYLTQIAYLMEYPAADLHPRVWQRLQANGAWGAWREMGWVDQLPLAGETVSLRPTPIDPGACVDLTASVPGAKTGMVVAASPAAAGQVAPGLRWDTAYVSSTETVTVPVCNATATAITPAKGAKLSVRVIP
jgi:hypothetical protein